MSETFKPDVGRYREEALARVRGCLALALRASGRGNLGRERIALHFDRERFFDAFELRAEGRARGALWRVGPELAGVFETPDGQVRLERRLVVSTDGDDLDSIRSVLLLEYQQILLDVIASLAVPRAGRVASLASGVMEDAAVAHTAMRLSALDDSAHEAANDIGLRFHERLVSMLRRQLLASYENEPAQMGIAFVAATHAGALRVRTVPERWIALLEQSKLGRVLSDGIETQFVFSSAGEYLGLHDRHGLEARGIDPRTLFGWRLRAGRGLVLHRGGEPVFELRDGRWAYRRDARLRARTERLDPSLAGANRSLWSVAARLADGRVGAILVVVADTAELEASGACRADLARAPQRARTARRSQDRLRATDPEGSARVGTRAPLEDYLLDQLQGRSCEELGVEILLKLASVDGALLVDTEGHLLGFGVIFATGVPESGQEGAGANAARFASRFGTAIKVSADGPISVFRRGSRV